MKDTEGKPMGVFCNNKDLAGHSGRKGMSVLRSRKRSEPAVKKKKKTRCPIQKRTLVPTPKSDEKKKEADLFQKKNHIQRRAVGLNLQRGRAAFCGRLQGGGKVRLKNMKRKNPANV